MPDNVHQVELDPCVLAISRRYLRSLHHGLLDDGQQIDARYTLRTGDGLAHIAHMQQQGECVDAMILDLTDPGGPSLPLWNADFFARCAQVLGDTGVLGLHVGAPWAQEQRCRDMLAALRHSFAQVTPFITDIPVNGGPWLMAIAAGLHAPAMRHQVALQQHLSALQGEPLQVLDGRILHAMVALAHRW